MSGPPGCSPTLAMMSSAGIDFNGHMSCRLPGHQHILINSGKSVRSASPSPTSSIDMTASPSTDVVPPMEFHIHTEIYRRRPDVNAVAHTHIRSGRRSSAWWASACSR
jgi:L-fuculose-phosphate aldolase